MQHEHSVGVPAPAHLLVAQQWAVLEHPVDAALRRVHEVPCGYCAADAVLEVHFLPLLPLLLLLLLVTVVAVSTTVIIPSTLTAIFAIAIAAMVAITLYLDPTAAATTIAACPLLRFHHP
jgi:hypothetical protein